MCRFLVVGDATVDQMYFVKEMPEPGGETNALRAVMEPGGAGGTIATVLARLGNEVLIATRVGTGPFSELALKHVRAAGVDVSLVQMDTNMQTSSVTILITPDTQRTMISAAGASRHLDVAELTAGAVASCDALVLSAYSLIGGPQREYAVQALDQARAAKLTTFIDLGSGAVNALKGRLITILREIDHVLMNEKELYSLTGESSISDAVAGLKQQGIQNLVVKVGEMGSIVITPELTELVDPHEIDDMMDSTGAGDYYTAGFAHAIMNGYDMLEAARFGNVAGALNVTKVGAQTVTFDAEALERQATSAVRVRH